MIVGALTSLSSLDCFLCLFEIERMKWEITPQLYDNGFLLQTQCLTHKSAEEPMFLQKCGAQMSKDGLLSSYCRIQI